MRGPWKSPDSISPAARVHCTPVHTPFTRGAVRGTGAALTPHDAGKVAGTRWQVGDWDKIQWQRKPWVVLGRAPLPWAGRERSHECSGSDFVPCPIQNMGLVVAGAASAPPLLPIVTNTPCIAMCSTFTTLFSSRLAPVCSLSSAVSAVLSCCLPNGHCLNHSSTPRPKPGTLLGFTLLLLQWLLRVLGLQPQL